MYKILAGSLFIVLAASAAVDAAPSAAVRAACLDDAKKFCSSVIHDDAARRSCMQSHDAELSAGCKAAVAAERGGQAGGQGKLATCRKLAHDKYFVENGRMLNNAVGAAVARCLKNGPSAI
jgi:hypothetical protein